MVYISQVMIANPDLEFFDDLCIVIKELGKRGETFLRFDVKPSYSDTPEDWEDRLEVSFSSRY